MRLTQPQSLVAIPVYLNSSRRELIFNAKFTAVEDSAVYFQKGIDLVLSSLAGSQ